MADAEDIVQRLQEAEATLAALRRGEIDAIVGREDVMIVCLREAEVALRRSLARYDTLLNSIDQGFCIIEVLFDADDEATDFRFIETNDAFESHTGIKDALGRRMRELAPDHEDAWFELYGRVALTGEPQQRRSRAAGFGRVFEVSAFRVDDPALRRVGVLFKDVTATVTEADRLRQSEQALRESEMRFRRLADTMPQLVWTATCDGVVDYYNSQVERYSGIRRDVDGAWAWQLVLHPDDLERTLEAWRAATQTGQQYEIEHRVGMDDGSFRWHLSRARRVGPPDALQWFGTATDVHDLKEAHERLRESEQRFKTMANTAPAMLWITDAEHQCTFISRGWQEHTGQREDQGLGFGWLEAVHPDDRAHARDVFMGAALRHEPFAFDYRLCTASGGYRWALDAGRPRFAGNGEFVGYIGSVFDVHERKQAEDALREADRRKDDFLAVLAHELRNPLAPIRNGLEVLRLAGAERGAASEARAMMQRQVDQMVRLIDDLLDTSRIARGKFELRRQRTDVVDALRRALETSRPLLDAGGHRLVLELPQSPLEVDADPVRIAQVFTNLLNNAAHYTDPQGRIRVCARKDGSEVVLEVEDDGVGIPEDMLDRVFEPFLQVETALKHGRHDGLGLGLALARSIVQLHGGAIRADRGPGGRGSIFTVRMPLLPAAPVEQTVVPTSPTVSRSNRVLVVDDNHDAAESLGMLLELMGHEVRIAHDGPGALRIAAEHPIDVVFLDIGMPGMDGYEVARRLRKLDNGNELRINALSGYGQDSDRRRSAAAGFDAHLVKPVEMDALERMLAMGPGGPPPERPPAPARGRYNPAP